MVQRNFRMYIMYNVAVFCFGQGQFEAITTLEGVPELLKFIQNNIPNAIKDLDKRARIPHGQGYRIEGELITTYEGTGDATFEELLVYFEPLPEALEGIYGADLIEGKQILLHHKAAVWTHSITSIQDEFSWMIIA